MSENITLVSKEYADSTFASGPVVKTITSSDGSVSVFTDGPNVDLKLKPDGEVKSDTWYCKCITQDMSGVGFYEDNISSIPGVIHAWSWGTFNEDQDQLNGKLLFENPMSLLEVNKALCHFEMFCGPIFKHNSYYAFAMCPFDEQLESLIPSYARQIL